MSWLSDKMGWSGKDIYFANASATKLVQYDSLRYALPKLVVEKVRKNYSGLQFVSRFSIAGDAMFANFKRVGSSFIYKYPTVTTQMLKNSESTDAFTDYLKQKHGDDIVVFGEETRPALSLSRHQIVNENYELEYTSSASTDYAYNYQFAVIKYMQENYNYNPLFGYFKDEDGYYHTVILRYIPIFRYDTISEYEYFDSAYVELICPVIRNGRMQEVHRTEVTVHNKNELYDTVTTKVYKIVTISLREEISSLDRWGTDTTSVSSVFSRLIQKTDRKEYLFSNITEDVPKGTVTAEVTYQLISDEVIHISENIIPDFIIKEPPIPGSKIINYPTGGYYYKDGEVYFDYVEDFQSTLYDSIPAPYKTYPIIPLREEKKFIYDLPDTDKKKKSVKNALNKLKIPFKKLTEALAENEDIDKIRDIYVLLAINPNSGLDLDDEKATQNLTNNQKRITTKLLYLYFKYMYDKYKDRNNLIFTVKVEEANYNSSLTWQVIPPEKIKRKASAKHRIGSITKKMYLNTTDPNEEFPLRYELARRSITYIMIDDIDYSFGITTVYYHEWEVVEEAKIKVRGEWLWGESFTQKHNLGKTKYYTTKPEYKITINLSTLPNPLPEIGVVTEINRQNVNLTNATIADANLANVIEFTKQVNATEAEVFYVFSLESWIDVRMTTDSHIQAVNCKSGDTGFLIPLPFEVVSKLSLKDKISAFGEVVYISCFAYDKKHLKWYQSESFVNFCIFVTFVIYVIVVYVSCGTLAKEATIGFMSIMEMLAVQVGISLALSLVIKWVSNPILKAVFAFAIMVVGMKVGLAISGKTFADLTISMLVANLAFMSMNAVTLTLQNISEKGKKVLQTDVNQFNTEYDKRQTQIDEISNKLFKSGKLTSADIVDLNTRTTGTSLHLFGVDDLMYASLELYRDRDSCVSNFVDLTVSNFVELSLY